MNLQLRGPLVGALLLAFTLSAGANADSAVLEILAGGLRQTAPGSAKVLVDFRTDQPVVGFTSGDLANRMVRRLELYGFESDHVGLPLPTDGFLNLTVTATRSSVLLELAFMRDVTIEFDGEHKVVAGASVWRTYRLVHLDAPSSPSSEVFLLTALDDLLARFVSQYTLINPRESW